MKFTCTKEHLDRALRYSTKATAKSSTLPIARNIAFVVEDNMIICIATNLDVGVRIRISGKIDDDGTVVVPPQLLTSFIASVPDGATISIEKKSDCSILVQSGTSRATIKGYDATDFPLIPQREGTLDMITIESDEFRNAVSRVVISVAKTEARPELTGVNIYFKDESIRIAATDGFRLSESILGLRGSIEAMEGRSMIIPASAITEVLHILSDSGSKEIKIYFGEGQIFIEIDEVIIVSRLISGTYPDYQQIIPKEITTDITISRRECEKVLRLADAFANQTTSDMKLLVNPTEGKCVISAISQDRGENTTTVAIEGKGVEQEIFLNTRYVLDGVNRCGSDRIRMAFSGSAAPVIISPVDADDRGAFLYLVMPIRK